MSAQAPRSEPDDLEALDRRSLLRHVRAWAEYRLADSSLRDLAVEAGISKSALGILVSGDNVPEKNWPKLRLWFLEDRKRHRKSPQDPATMALLVEEMLANVPAAERPRAFARVVEEVAALHEEACAPRPGWLDVLQGSATRAGGGAEP